MYNRSFVVCDRCKREFRPGVILNCHHEAVNKHFGEHICMYCCMKCKHHIKHVSPCAVSCGYKEDNHE